MPVTIAIGKQKTQVETQVEAGTEQVVFDPLVDELAELMAWAAKQKKDAREVRLAELKKIFADKVKLADNDEPTVVFEGEKNRYTFGAPAKVRTITVEGKEKFATYVGEEAFLECATIALGDLDKYIPLVEQDDYIIKSLGSRSGKLEAKVVQKKK